VWILFKRESLSSRQSWVHKPENYKFHYTCRKRKALNVLFSDCFVSHNMEDDQEEQDRDTVGKMVNNSIRSSPL